MAAHKGPASLRPRCTRGGSCVAAIPVYESLHIAYDPLIYDIYIYIYITHHQVTVSKIVSVCSD
jgi:hypothetical protein